MPDGRIVPAIHDAESGAAAISARELNPRTP
jgi:hypothetical protein